MVLIRKLGTKIDKNNKWRVYGLFLCPYCLQEVKKEISNGKKQNSCGCMKSEFSSKTHKGKKVAEESKKKNSETHKKLYKNKENHPMYGKYHTEETINKIKHNMPDFSGKNNPNYGNGEKIKGKNNPMYGKSGELNPNWNGGSSFDLYSPEWNKELKQFIKDRDLNICQTPNCFGDKRLNVHHIDYDKKNSAPDNLITLCNSCHAKTNFNRMYYQNYYFEIINVYL